MTASMTDKEKSDWIAQACKAIKADDIAQVHALDSVFGSSICLSSHALLGIMDAERPDMLEVLLSKGLRLGEHLRPILHKAIEYPAWRPSFEAGLLQEAPDVSKLFPVEALVFTKAPEWLTHIVQTTVKAWPEQTATALWLASNFHDLPRMILYLAGGAVPAEDQIGYGSNAVCSLLTYGRSNHARCELLTKIGSLEQLLAAPIAAQVSEIWPDFPIYDLNSDL